MLAVKRSTGVTLNVDLGNPLHTGKTPYSQGMLSLKTHCRRRQKSELGESVTPQSAALDLLPFRLNVTLH